MFSPQSGYNARTCSQTISPSASYIKDRPNLSDKSYHLCKFCNFVLQYKLRRVFCNWINIQCVLGVLYLLISLNNENAHIIMWSQIFYSIQWLNVYAWQTVDGDMSGHIYGSLILWGEGLLLSPYLNTCLTFYAAGVVLPQNDLQCLNKNYCMMASDTSYTNTSQ